MEVQEHLSCIENKNNLIHMNLVLVKEADLTASEGNPLLSYKAEPLYSFLLSASALNEIFQYP